MNVTPLTLSPRGALVQELRARGWDPGMATTAASGVMPLAVRCTGLDASALEALVAFGGRQGLDIITGPDWAVIAGSRARLGALARPWVVPEPLQELATQLGSALPAELATRWQVGSASIALDAPLLVGILNVTPDSFSDGGQLGDESAVLARAKQMVADGAGMLDVGGESTRPGRTAEVPVDEELRRVTPVVQLLVRELPGVAIAVDTIKADVARAALDAGAMAINDVSGLRHDAAMAGVVAKSGAGLVLMHSRGANLELSSYQHTSYPDDLIGTVIRELREGLAKASRAGIPDANVAIDPGFGFGKTPEQGLQLLEGLDALQCLDRPIYVGPSRKRFVAVRGDTPAERDGASATVCALAWERGARIFRVHDVKRTRQSLDVVRALGAERMT